MNDIKAIDLPLDEIRQYCAAQPIARLSLLGPDFDGWLRPDTEIGLLVDYLPGATVSLFDMAGQEIDLKAITSLGVCLHTANGLRRGCLGKHAESARLIYER